MAGVRKAMIHQAAGSQGEFSEAGQGPRSRRDWRGDCRAGALGIGAGLVTIGPDPRFHAFNHIPAWVVMLRHG